MEIKCSVEELKQLSRSFILTEKQEIKIDEEVEEITYTWFKDDFYMVDTRSNKINIGYPLK